MKKLRWLVLTSLKNWAGLGDQHLQSKAEQRLESASDASNNTEQCGEAVSVTREKVDVHELVEDGAKIFQRQSQSDAKEWIDDGFLNVLHYFFVNTFIQGFFQTILWYTW